MIRRLRALFGTVRARLLGAGQPIVDESPPATLMQCLHPRKAWTACTWQLGPKGTWGWFMRCARCRAWFAC